MMADVEQTLPAIAPSLSARHKDTLRQQNTACIGIAAQAQKLQNPATEELPEYSNPFQLLRARVKSQTI